MSWLGATTSRFSGLASASAWLNWFTGASPEWSGFETLVLVRKIRSVSTIGIPYS